MDVKPRLRYTRRGWFSVWTMFTGKRDFRTGITVPDEYGCTLRRMIIGPYATAAEAASNA